MNLLLDTHAFLWYVRDDPQMSEKVTDAIEDPANRVVSIIVSLWEITIKSSLGKLDLEIPIADFFRENVDNNGFQTLAVSLSHLVTTHDLPFHHRDPFDRMLIAQATTESMTFATNDGEARKYAVTCLC